ncbi:hypothetical protein ABPG72_010485 [Tetrahymena utriculariae]
MIPLLLGIFLLTPQISCFEILNASSLVNDQAKQNSYSLPANINLGTPPQNIQVMFNFGTDFPNLGQFIFNKSVQNTDEFLDMLQQQTGIKNQYDLNSSTTSEIKDNQVSYAEITGEQREPMYSIYVQDVFQIGKIKFKYYFARSYQIGKIHLAYSGGLIIFQRTQDNIFYLMYRQQVIKTRDYILQRSTQIISSQYSNQVIYNLQILFDLESNSKYYSYPQNQLIPNSDLFEIYCYGIYLDTEDVSDKIKYKKVQIHQLTSKISYFSPQIRIPSDLYQMIPSQYDQIANQLILNCSVLMQQSQETPQNYPYNIKIQVDYRKQLKS